jgi:hypothetical protein
MAALPPLWTVAQQAHHHQTAYLQLGWQLVQLPYLLYIPDFSNTSENSDRWISRDSAAQKETPPKSDFYSQNANEHNCGHPGERGKKSKSPKPKNNSFHATTIFNMNPPPQKPTSHQ